MLLLFFSKCLLKSLFQHHRKLPRSLKVKCISALDGHTALAVDTGLIGNLISALSKVTAYISKDRETVKLSSSGSKPSRNLHLMGETRPRKEW